ncbi:MAG TPA: hypothetical protein GX717_01180 [Clostridiaceae bacterium]|nr:hypothetical protein [Clostridiaceae bacterium]
MYKVIDKDGGTWTMSQKWMAEDLTARLRRKGRQPTLIKLSKEEEEEHNRKIAEQERTAGYRDGFLFM